MKYHFIGIKGSGMSALACILSDLGHEITGSDIQNPVFTEQSLNQRAIYAKEFNVLNLENIDLVIIGNAFNESNCEVNYTINQNIAHIRYFEFIDKLAKNYTSIAIAGTNGKTTTTGIVTSLFKDEQIISLIGDGNGFADANADKFIFEACEYKETFLNYHPDITVINNIEMDHPDFFRDTNHVIEVFQKLADQSKLIIVNGDDSNVAQIKHNNKITFGLKAYNNLFLTNLESSKNGYKFNLMFNGIDLGLFSLNMVGMHMLYNALASIAIGLYLKKPIIQIMDNINQFKGAKRRFEIDILDEQNNVILIDDYAHHPTAINLVIDAIKQKYRGYETTILFQPHTYSRTIEFLDEFAQSLSLVDNLFLADIFGSARETRSDISIDILIKACEKKGQFVHRDINFIKNKNKNHVIAILGAGDIDQLYKQPIKDMFRR